MEKMFEGCLRLTCLDLSECNIINVRDVKDMFSSCARLAKIITPKTIKEGSIILERSDRGRFYDSKNNNYVQIDSSTPPSTVLLRRWTIKCLESRWSNYDGLNPAFYTVETETFTLNNPEREGYIFLGWTGYNGQEPQTPQIVVTIEKGTTGDLTYTAHWKKNDSKGDGNTDEHTHIYNSGWEFDSDTHWKECECGEKSEAASHTFVWKIDQAATMTETGLKHEECTVCGYTQNENTIIEKLDENHTHEYGGRYWFNETGHWQECECGSSSDLTAHGFIWITDQEATGKNTGLKHEECTICGYERNESTVIDKKSEEHTLVRVDAQAPTCRTEGNISYYRCTTCGKQFSDHDGTKEISVSEIKKAKTAHSISASVTKASSEKDGMLIEKCTVCGEVLKTETIYCLKEIILGKESYQYTGKPIKPAVIVKSSDGKQIAPSNYSITYSKNKEVGKAVVQISLKGNYSGVMTKIFTIYPKGTSLAKISAESNGFTAKWKKQPVHTTGYEVQYSTSKKFTKKATQTKIVKKASQTSLTVKKLKSKKTYYVRIRTFQTSEGKKYYSNWSKTASVKTEK